MSNGDNQEKHQAGKIKKKHKTINNQKNITKLLQNHEKTSKTNFEKT
jgi:hypothetical protein